MLYYLHNTCTVYLFIMLLLLYYTYGSTPKRFFGDVILLRRKYRAKFSKKHIYSFSSIFMLLNEYHVINRAESSLERERFSKIVNKPPRGLHGARLRAQPIAPRRIATRHNYCELGFIRDAAAAHAIIV